jgi:4-hydroxymandelate oxidase
LNRRVSRAHTPDPIEAYHLASRERLAPDVYEFFACGSGEEITRAEAEQSWRRWRLRPRVLRPVGHVDPSVDLLGLKLAAPLLVAPVAMHRLVHGDGELATATAARDAGSLLVVSTRASTSLEEIARTGVPWWLQVYVLRDRALTRDLVRRAAELGARALVLTGDTPVVARKRATERPRIDALWRTLLPAGAADYDCEQDPDASLADIDWLARESGLPVLVKGVLRADDARACMDAGACGVVVSNHGGRQLDRVVASALALTEVADEIGGRGLTLVDGGLRSGLDVLTALALGADAVCLGRPVIWGLAADGAAGVERVLRHVGEELVEAMRLAGAASRAEITPDLIWTDAYA